MLASLAIVLPAVLLGSVTAASAVDAFPAADQAALERIVREGMEAQRQPGLIVSIDLPGRGTWRAAFGKADIDSGREMAVDDHIRIASITKTFTGVAVLRLVDQGKLSLDDNLETFIPGIANGDRITIRNLLGMTSGIYDFTMDETFDRDFEANPLMPFGISDVIAIVKRHEPEFAPGEKVSYCDSNYSFLGTIIEKVTGKTAGVFIAEEILAPLKLTGTSYPTTGDIPEPFARGYFAGDDGKGAYRDYTATNPDVASTAGAMISTVADLGVWAKSLASGALLTPATHAEQMKFATLPARGLSVGYGLGIGRFDGFVGHNGAILGYSTAMFFLPEQGATIVVAGNQASNFSNAATEIVFRIGAYLFPAATEAK